MRNPSQLVAYRLRTLIATTGAALAVLAVPAVASASTAASVSLNRYFDSSTGVHWSDSTLDNNADEVPVGFTEEGVLGYLYTSPGPGLQALYSCVDGGQGNYISTQSDCEVAENHLGDVHVLGIVGYDYVSAPSDGTSTTGLYRCLQSSPFDHLETTSSTCEGVGSYNLEGSLGYILLASPGTPLPESPVTIALPAAGIALFGTAAVVSTRRRGRNRPVAV